MMGIRTLALTTSLATLAACGSAPDTTAPGNAATVALPPAPIASAPASAAGRPLPIAPPATAATAHAAFYDTLGGWRPVRYLCDGIRGDGAIVVTAPDDAGNVRIEAFDKPSFRATSRPARLGEGDAGAGSVFRDLLAVDGTAIGAVRSINPGMLGDAAATTLPTLSSIRLGEDDTRCRWLPRGRVLLVTARRSAIVTADARGGYTYRSFDHDRPGTAIEGGEAGSTSTPTAEVRGGRLVASEPGRETYQFDAPPWTYRVTASARTGAPGAEITVLRDGTRVLSEAARAYEMAAARID